MRRTAPTKKYRERQEADHVGEEADDGDEREPGAECRDAEGRSARHGFAPCLFEDAHRAGQRLPKRPILEDQDRYDEECGERPGGANEARDNLADEADAILYRPNQHAHRSSDDGPHENRNEPAASRRQRGAHRGIAAAHPLRRPGHDCGLKENTDRVSRDVHQEQWQIHARLEPLDARRVQAKAERNGRDDGRNDHTRDKRQDHQFLVLHQHPIGLVYELKATTDAAHWRLLRVRNAIRLQRRLIIAARAADRKADVRLAVFRPAEDLSSGPAGTRYTSRKPARRRSLRWTPSSRT